MPFDRLEELVELYLDAKKLIDKLQDELYASEARAEWSAAALSEMREKYERGEDEPAE